MHTVMTILRLKLSHGAALCVRIAVGTAAGLEFCERYGVLGSLHSLYHSCAQRVSHAMLITLMATITSQRGCMSE